MIERFDPEGFRPWRGVEIRGNGGAVEAALGNGFVRDDLAHLFGRAGERQAERAGCLISRSFEEAGRERLSPGMVVRFGQSLQG